METSFEDASRKLQVSYQLLFERNPLPMWVYDVQSLRLLAVNDAAVAEYGYSRHEFAELTLLDLHHADDLPQLQAHLQLPASEQARQRLWRHRHRNGDLIEAETVTEALELDGIRARMVLVKDMSGQRRAEQAQRELAQRLTTTLESITEAFLTLDRAGRFTYVNSRAEDLLSRQRDELLGRNVWEVFPALVGSIYQIEYDRAMAEGETVSFESFFAPLKVWLSVLIYPSEQGLAVYFRDVTEKHAVEQELHEERETLSAVVNASSDAIISIDVEGRIKMFNPGAERIFRRARSSVEGQEIDLLLPERFRAVHRQQRRRFAESGESTRMMGLYLVKGLRSDGQELDLEGTISQVRVHQQQVLIVSLRDVTERLRANAEFAQSRAQLSELTQKLMMQEKTLVKRLAQALHDQLGQTMAAIRMVHETIVALQRDKADPGIDRLEQQMGTLIGQAIRQIRQVLIDLRPPLLEEHGLAAALDNELRNRSLTHPLIDISIAVAPDVALMRWPAEVEYAAFMICREAVENALRHSGASSLSVRLSGGALALHLEVADSGVGLAEGGARRPGHLGIASMFERANSIGAQVTVGSGENQGTRVGFSWRPPS